MAMPREPEKEPTLLSDAAEKQRLRVSEAQKALRIAVDRIREAGSESDGSANNDGSEEDDKSSKKQQRAKPKRQSNGVTEAKAPKLRPAGGM